MRKVYALITYQDDDQPYFLVCEGGTSGRRANPRQHGHLPGGTQDRRDRSHEETVLRELREEIPGPRGNDLYNAIRSTQLTGGYNLTRQEVGFNGTNVTILFYELGNDDIEPGEVIELDDHWGDDVDNRDSPFESVSMIALTNDNINQYFPADSNSSWFGVGATVRLRQLEQRQQEQQQATMQDGANDGDDDPNNDNDNDDNDANGNNGQRDRSGSESEEKQPEPEQKQQQSSHEDIQDSRSVLNDDQQKTFQQFMAEIEALSNDSNNQANKPTNSNINSPRKT